MSTNKAAFKTEEELPPSSPKSAREIVLAVRETASEMIIKHYYTQQTRMYLEDFYGLYDKKDPLDVPCRRALYLSALLEKITQANPHLDELLEPYRAQGLEPHQIFAQNKLQNGTLVPDQPVPLSMFFRKGKLRSKPRKKKSEDYFLLSNIVPPEVAREGLFPNIHILPSEMERAITEMNQDPPESIDYEGKNYPVGKEGFEEFLKLEYLVYHYALTPDILEKDRVISPFEDGYENSIYYNPLMLKMLKKDIETMEVNVAYLIELDKENKVQEAEALLEKNKGNEERVMQTLLREVLPPMVSYREPPPPPPSRPMTKEIQMARWSEFLRLRQRRGTGKE